MHASFEWNYTTVLNLICWAIAALVVYRFLRTGGPAMLKMMIEPSGSDGHRGTSTHEHAALAVVVRLRVDIR